MTEMFKDELAPLNLAAEGFWEIACRSMVENPGKGLPVILLHPETGDRLGEFFLVFETRRDSNYVVVQGFSSNILERAFVSSSTKDWVMVQEGIYELKV